MGRSRQYRTGLIYYDRDFAFRGYTLFCGGNPACAYLIDMQGRICQRWMNERGITYASLLPDGHLLCRATSSPDVQGLHGLNGQAPSIFELDWQGNLVWLYEDQWLHHDHERLPNGNTLICDSAVGRFFEVTPAQEIVWEYVNPFYAHNPRLGGKINIVFRAHRYGPDNPALLDRNLDPARCGNLNRLFNDDKK